MAMGGRRRVGFEVSISENKYDLQKVNYYSIIYMKVKKRRDGLPINLYLSMHAILARHVQAKTHGT